MPTRRVCTPCSARAASRVRPRSSTIARLTSWCSERSSSLGDGSFQLTGFGAGPTGMASWTTSVGASSAVGTWMSRVSSSSSSSSSGSASTEASSSPATNTWSSPPSRPSTGSSSTSSGSMASALVLRRFLGAGSSSSSPSKMVMPSSVEMAGASEPDLEERVDAAAHDALGGLHAVGGLLGRGAHRDAGGHDEADHGEGDEHEPRTPRWRAGSSAGRPRRCRGSRRRATMSSSGAPDSGRPRSRWSRPATATTIRPVPTTRRTVWWAAGSSPWRGPRRRRAPPTTRPIGARTRRPPTRAPKASARPPPRGPAMSA